MINMHSAIGLSSPKTKAPLRERLAHLPGYWAFSLFPVFVFYLYPADYRRVSPDVNTPHIEHVVEVPVCVDTVSVSDDALFASEMLIF
ncbi:hypothetical protein KY1_07344 [Salmonella enterica subsp. enterica serovar Cerro str. FSL R8-0235]|nr:hypothetical protein KY1_07344 [Salmonella enterica subsp. enterica serovar Cerro str. FSL R8-0235]